MLKEIALRTASHTIRSTYLNIPDSAFNLYLIFADYDYLDHIGDDQSTIRLSVPYIAVVEIGVCKGE